MANRLLRWTLAAGCALAWLPGLGCGARSSLKLDAQADGGASHAGGGGAGGAGVGGEGAGLPACRYVSAGAPIVAMTFPDRHAVSASQIAVAPGTTDSPGLLALQALASGGNSPLHPVNEMVRLSIGNNWPDDVASTAPFSVGAESHSYALLELAAGAADSMALTWYSDLGGYGRLAFRRINVGDSTPGPIVDIDLTGHATVALERGAAVGEFGVGYAGDGYALLWRHSLTGAEPLQVVVGIVDLQGQLVLGPHNVTPLMPQPPSTAAVWTGSYYVMATAFGNCPPNEPLCAAQSVRITRLRPSSGDGVDDSGVDVVATLPPQTLDQTPLRPTLSHFAGRTWLAWTEASLTTPGPERQLLLLELNADGTPIGTPQQIASNITPLSRPDLIASDQGIALIWQEMTGDDGPPDQPGIAATLVLPLDGDGLPLDEPAALPVTLPQGVVPSAAVLAQPRALMVSWSGRQIGGGFDHTFLARFDCVPAL